MDKRGLLNQKKELAQYDRVGHVLQLHEFLFCKGAFVASRELAVFQGRLPMTSERSGEDEFLVEEVVEVLGGEMVLHRLIVEEVQGKRLPPHHLGVKFLLVENYSPYGVASFGLLFS